MKQSLTSDVIAEKVIGCAYEVHMVLGNGFRESTYQKALAMELKNAGLEVEPVMRSQIQIESVKTNTILIEGKVLVTLNIKAQNDKFREDMEENLRTKALESGILLNFGDRNVTFKQINP